MDSRLIPQLRDFALGNRPLDTLSKDSFIELHREIFGSVGDTARTSRSDYLRRLQGANADAVRNAADRLAKGEAKAADADAGSDSVPADAAPAAPAVPAVPTPPIATTPPAADDMAALGALIRKLAGSTVDEGAVRKIVADVLGNTAETVGEAIRRKLAAEVRHVTVQVGEQGERKDMGVQHRMFATLLQMCSGRTMSGYRLNVFLSGPAGSGKTTAAEKVAEALGLKFAFNGAIDTEYKLLGFTDAQGRVVHRPFRHIYEHGGVYLFDECDGSLPGALLALNAALANGYCDFPDGPVKRHPDCIVIAAANTWGYGATFDYVGRNKLDAASLDRFVRLAWPYDESLERALATDTDWCAYVQKCRLIASQKGLKVVISPRATYHGCALLETGMSKRDVANAVLLAGLTDEQRGFFPQPE